MGTFLFFILKSSVCLFLFTILYITLLKSITHFRFSRWAFWVGTLLCWLIPLIPVSVSILSPIQQSVMMVGEIFEEMPSDGKVAIGFLTENGWDARVEHLPFQQGKSEEIYGLSLLTVISLFYTMGAVGVFLFFVYSFGRLWHLIHGKPVQREGSFRLVILPGKVCSFSWWKYIVMSEEDYRQDGSLILIHEKMHLSYYHTLDLGWMHCLLIFHWFNPMTWVLWQELRDLHEYEADEGVISSGVNMVQYQLLLVKKAVGTRLYSMANGFDHSKLKNRIGMMLKKRSNGWVRLRMLLAVPVAAGVVYAFAQPEMSEKQVLLQMELMTQDALLQDSIAESKLTEEIASMKQFFKEKSDAWWKHHRTPEGRYVWRTTQTHRLYMNGSNEVMFDTVVYKILTDPRQVIAGRLRSAREADRLEKKKDEPRFLYMVYDVNSDKRQVLGMLKEIKLAFDDLRAEYVAKGASDVDEVCPYMVYVYGPRKYGVNGAELLIGAAGAEPQERIHDITGNRLKSYQGRYGKNASVLLRVDNSVSERGYIEMCKRVKRYFPAAKTEHEK